MWTQQKAIPGWLMVTVLLGFANPGFAEDVRNYSGKDPSVSELIGDLKPKGPSHTRGVSLGSTTAGGGAAAVSVVTSPKISFDQVRFGLNSDRLTPTARRFLDKLGAAMQSEDLTGLEFVIEGHTDSTGSLS